MERVWQYNAYHKTCVVIQLIAVYLNDYILYNSFLKGLTEKLCLNTVCKALVTCSRMKGYGCLSPWSVVERSGRILRGTTMDHTNVVHVVYHEVSVRIMEVTSMMYE